MRESIIESELVKCVKRIGGKAYKFVSPGNNGVPDRLVCLPGGRAIFVELKAPGRTPTKQQLLRHKELRKLGFAVEVISSTEAVDELIQKVIEVMPNEI